MLFDYDFKNEILLKPVGNYFSSVLGKTMGALEPHEFWYFWRRFFHFSGVQQLEQQILEVSNSDLFIKELRAMQSVWSKPLLLKGMIMNWHIPFLASLYPKSYFLYVERSFAANAASLVRAREMFSGDENQWYSFKPPGYERVLHLDPNCQATWQVMATNQAIDVGLAEIPQSRVFRVTYDNFCRNPQSLLNEICLRFQKTVPQVDHLPDRFDIQGEDITIDKKWSEVLAKAASFLQLQVRQSER